MDDEDSACNATQWVALVRRLSLLVHPLLLDQLILDALPLDIDALHNAALPLVDGLVPLLGRSLRVGEEDLSVTQGNCDIRDP